MRREQPGQSADGLVLLSGQFEFCESCKAFLCETREGLSYARGDGATRCYVPVSKTGIQDHFSMTVDDVSSRARQSLAETYRMAA